MVDKTLVGVASAMLMLALAVDTAHAADASASRATIERGRYMLDVGNCNDCHTANFAPSDGKVPEKDWLLGDGVLGFSGPWGTTYAPNLRLALSKMTEGEWVKYAKVLKTRPPMPWFNLETAGRTPTCARSIGMSETWVRPEARCASTCPPARPRRRPCSSGPHRPSES